MLKNARVIPVALLTSLVMVNTACQAGKLKILYAYMDKTSVDKVISDYRKTHSSTSITAVELTNYENPAMDFAQKPDLYMGNSTIMGQIADLGIFADIGKLMPKQILKDIMPGFIDSFTVGKTLLGLPISGIFTDLAFNVDTFNQNGLPLPSKDWDWENSVYKACLKLSKDTNGDGTIDKYGLLGLPENQFSSVIYSYGGSLVDKSFKKITYTQKSAWDAINLITRLHSERLAEENKYVWTGKEDDLPFNNGKSAMRLNYGNGYGKKLSYLTNIKFAAQSVPVPKGPKGRIPTAYASAMGLVENSRNKPDTIDFIKYILTKSEQLSINKANYSLPVTLSALNDKSISKVTQPELLKTYVTSHATGFRKDFEEIETRMWSDVLKLAQGNITKAQFISLTQDFQKRLTENPAYPIYID